MVGRVKKTMFDGLNLVSSFAYGSEKGFPIGNSRPICSAWAHQAVAEVSVLIERHTIFKG